MGIASDWLRRVARFDSEEQTYTGMPADEDLLKAKPRSAASEWLHRVARFDSEEQTYTGMPADEDLLDKAPRHERFLEDGVGLEVLDASEVEKYNEHHDEKGRFASSDGEKYRHPEDPNHMEQTAIRDYSERSKGLNTALRTDSLSGQETWAKENGWKDAGYFKANMDAFLDRQATERDSTMWRGVRSDGHLKETLAGMKVGDVLLDKGYMSATTDQKIAREWTAGGLSSDVMEVKVPKGSHVADIGPYSTHSYEDEVLFARNSRLRYDGTSGATHKFTLLDAGSKVQKFNPNHDEHGRFASGEGGSVVGFHGTSEDVARRIIKEGFTIKVGKHNFDSGLYAGERGESVFLTPDEKAAVAYASDRAQTASWAKYERLSAVVFKVEVPKDEWRGFKEDTLEEGAAYVHKTIPPAWIKGVYSADSGALMPIDLTKATPDHVVVYMVVFATDPISKYNPNHDELGRFATGDGSGGKTEEGTDGRGGRESGLAEAQRAAAQAADGRKPLEGLPQKPLTLGGKPFVPGPVGYIHDAAEKYMKDAGLEYDPVRTYQPVDPERAARIADEFDSMKYVPNDPAVKASYDAMIKETHGQYLALKDQGVKFEFIKKDQADPYSESPRLAQQDLIDNKHLWVYPTDSGFGNGTPEAAAAMRDNPLLRETGERIGDHKLLANDEFRIVHDMYGHFKEGNGFRASGEENAWRSHSTMYSDVARPAMTSETRGQNSWVNYGPHGEANRTASAANTVFAPQKIGIMKEWTRTEGARDPVRRISKTRRKPARAFR